MYGGHPGQHADWRPFPVIVSHLDYFEKPLALSATFRVSFSRDVVTGGAAGAGPRNADRWRSPRTGMATSGLWPGQSRRGHRGPPSGRGSCLRSGDAGVGGVATADPAARGWHEARPSEDPRADHGVGDCADRGVRVDPAAGHRAAKSAPAGGLPPLAGSGAGRSPEGAGPAPGAELAAPGPHPGPVVAVGRPRVCRGASFSAPCTNKTLNEGRGLNPGDTVGSATFGLATFLAQRGPGPQPRRHQAAAWARKWYFNAQRRPGPEPRRHPPKTDVGGHEVARSTKAGA